MAPPSRICQDTPDTRIEDSTDHTQVQQTWKLVNDPVERRKLQNRLNQRSSRQRQAELKRGEKPLIVKRWSVNVSSFRKRPGKCALKAPCLESPVLNDSKSIRGDASAAQAFFVDVPTTVTDPKGRFHTLIDEDGAWTVTAAQRYPVDIEEKLYIECKTSIGETAGRAEKVSLPADHLLTLIYYNVLRGLVWNISILGLDPTEIEKDECSSPFTSSSLASTPAVMQLPPSLRPTLSQRKKHHHPYIDIFPCPVVRDNIIQHEIDINGEDDGLCTAIFGVQNTCESPGSSTDDELCTSTTLWGDPWDLRQWEMSEYVVARWKHIFRGAWELQASTNQRRKMRGWREICFM